VTFFAGRRIDTNGDRNSLTLRIGYIAPSFDDTTGWGRWVNDFLRHIVQEGVDPVVWAPASSRKHFEEAGHAFEVRYSLPELFDYLLTRKGITRFPTIGVFLREVGRDFNLRLVHSLEAYPWCLYGDHLARRRGIPHVITSHGRYGYIASNRWLDRRIYGNVLRRASRVVAVSEAVKREIVRRHAGFIPLPQITSINNAVDSVECVADGMHRRMRKINNGSPPTILSVTRLIKVKGIEASIKTFARVKSRVPDARFLIVGPGNNEKNGYYRAIRKLISEKEIEGITFIGRVGRNETEEYYRSADVLLHTPVTLKDDFDSCPMVLLEAGLSGTPIVATRSGGVPEIISDGVNGLLADEGDVERLAELVTEILLDPEKASLLGRNNRRIALERNWEWYAGLQSRIYEELIDG